MNNIIYVHHKCAHVHAHTHTHTQRRVMELKRASLILNTPPVTPRNSLLISSSAAAGGNGSQLFDIEEFLNQFDPEGGGQGMIPEVEETESEQHLHGQPTTEFLPSQHSSTSALSQTEETGSQTTTPVRLDPGANSNSNNNNSNDDEEACSVVRQDKAAPVDLEPANTTMGEDKLASSTPISTNGEQHCTTISWGNASTISSTSISSRNEKRTLRVIRNGGADVTHHPEPSPLDKPRVNFRLENADESRLLIPRSPCTLPKSRSSEMLRQEAKGGGKAKSAKLTKKAHHKSSGDILEDDAREKRANGKPPLVWRKPHKSSSDLTTEKKAGRGGRGLAADGRTRAGSTGARTSLSGLTDLSQEGEMKISSGGGKTKKKNPKRLSLPSWGIRSSPTIPSRVTHSPRVPRAPFSPTSDDDTVWRDYGKI